MAWEYTKQVKALFQNAMQGTTDSHIGEILDADGIGQHGSIVCGDAITFYFKVEKAADPKNDRITQVRYKTFGCTSAIASSEALCKLIEQKNPTPIEALKITNKEIVDFLGGLPEQKIHCSVMGAEVLQDAIHNWAKRRGIDLGKSEHHADEDEGQITCECYNLSKNYITRKVQELKLKTIDEVQNAVKAGGGCGACHHIAGGLQDILNEVNGTSINAQNEIKSNSNFEVEIKNFLEKEMPSLLQGSHPLFSVLKIKESKLYLSRHDGVTTTVLDSAKREMENILKSKISKEVMVIDV